MSDDRPAWMPDKWSNSNQVMATRVFKALCDLNKAINALDKHEAQAVMHALDQQHAHHMCSSDIPEVKELKQHFECVNDVDLFAHGPRVQLELLFDVEITPARQLGDVVRRRLGFDD